MCFFAKEEKHVLDVFFGKAHSEILRFHRVFLHSKHGPEKIDKWHPTLRTPPHSTLHSLHCYGNRGRMYKTVEKIFHKNVLRDCIRVRGLHLVLKF